MMDATNTYTAALLGFGEEALGYCNGISDTVAREYATLYARAVMDRAKGLAVDPPRIPGGLFQPNRNLICATLERMREKYRLRK